MSRISPQFNKMYSSLNQAQKSAVDLIDGPVLVEAGPGTGKTQILALRIANILKITDTPGDAILALTFTRAGVYAMRKRLVEIIGNDAYRVGIFTFHGFCEEVIKKYQELFPRISGSSPANDVEILLIIREIVETGKWEHLRPWGKPFMHTGDIRSKISELKRENISPSELNTIIKNRIQEINSSDDLIHKKGAHKGKMKADYKTELVRLDRLSELAHAYTMYEKSLRSRHLYDYEDMIVEVLNTLKKNKDLLLSLQEEYQYILADEHQDANLSQNALLEMLSNFHKNPNIFAVGDEKQAIYRFQGASSENFSRFKKAYPGTKTVTLTDSFRSGALVLNSANALITCNLKPVSKSGSVELREFTREEYEKAWVSETIKTDISRGVLPREIAVFTRTNAEASEWAQEFEKRNVPFLLIAKKNVLSNKAVRILLHWISAVAYPGSSAVSRALLTKWSGVPALDAYKILRTAQESRVDSQTVFSNKDLLEKSGADKKLVLKFFSELNELTEFVRDSTVPESVAEIIRRVALPHIIKSANAHEHLVKLGAFLNEVETLSGHEKDYTLESLLEHLALLEEYGVSVSEANEGVAEGKIRLMTAHSAKGLEFENVFIVGLRNGMWGNRRNNDIFKIPGIGNIGVGGDIDDERRLFFVALTRAKSSIYLSYSKTDKNGSEKLQSQFLEEIGDTCSKVSVDSFESAQDPKDRFLNTMSESNIIVNKTIPVNADFLVDAFHTQGFSVTAINNYLSCPWKYFFKNLVRIPEAKPRYLHFGDAIHKALQRFFEVPESKEKNLIKFFVQSLERTPLSVADLEEAKYRGEEMLKKWHKNASSDFGTHLHSELPVLVNVPQESEIVPRILLRGIIDRISSDKEGLFIVTDFKTGKPKSRKDIIGESKSEGSGDYFRQLVFYKILLRHFKNGKFLEHKSVIEFIDSGKKNELVREVFNLSEEDEQQLLKEIKRISEEIETLSFWEKRCGKKDCEYCALRDLAES